VTYTANGFYTPEVQEPLTARVMALTVMTMAELQGLWKVHFKRPAPKYSRVHMERRLAYRIQEIEYEKYNPELLQRNRERIAALVAAEEERRAPGRPKKVDLPPGTVLTREYGGVEHEVLVRADGQFDYAGKPYASLSMVARTITGTHWSGPLFFGLRRGRK
jgi:hypothetical protein